MKKGGDMEKLYDKLKEKSSDQAKGRRSLGFVFSVVLLFVDTGFLFRSTAQDTIIETLEQLNKKLNSQFVTLEKSLGDLKQSSGINEEQLRTEKARTEKLEREKKELQVELEKARAVPPTAPLPPDLKKLEDEVKEWKSQVNMYKGKVEEKQTQSEFLELRRGG